MSGKPTPLRDGEPTPLVRPVPLASQYPLDALGPILGPAARAIAEGVQVPDALAANSVLATAALAAQPYANIQTLGGPRPISLFLLTVAMSGDRKSSADSVAVSPVHQHVQQLQTTYAARVTEYRRAQEVLALRRSLARSKAKSADSPDEYAVALAEIAEEPPPRPPYVICTEPTPDGLFLSLRNGQYGQGIYSDEAGIFLGGHALATDAELRTVGMLSKLWDGAAIDRVRAKDSKPHVTLYGRRFSMHLMAQPEVAARMLGNRLYRGQGFLARFLIAYPLSLAGTRLHDEASRVDLNMDYRIQHYRHAISELLAQSPRVNAELGGFDPPILTLAHETREHLVEEYNRIEAGQRAGGEYENVREWASKGAEHACRIAGVQALVSNPAATEVPPETMHNALVVARWYLTEYQRVVGVTGVSEEIQRAQTLLEWIRRKGVKSLKPRDVMNSGPNSIRAADVARAALATLVEFGWLHTSGGKVYCVDQAATSATTATMSQKSRVSQRARESEANAS